MQRHSRFSAIAAQRALLTMLAAALTTTPVTIALAQTAARTGTVIEKFDDWSLLSDGPQKTMCFIAATATGDPKATSDPKGSKATPSVVLYVSAWPKEGVKAEISVKLPQKLKKGTEVTLSVGTASFKLFVKDDKAYVEDATRELKLIDAMKKGAKIVLQTPDTAGDTTPDTFSLSGFGQALQALATRCP